MNKYEQLIEYIINDQEEKARELFHSIVVEKSRDIYESLMDETVDEYDQQGDLVDDVTEDEFGGEDMGDDMGDDMDDDMDDDMGDDMGDDEDEYTDVGDESGELDSEFDQIMSRLDAIDDELGIDSAEGDSGVNDDEMGDGEIDGGEDMDVGAGDDFGDDSDLDDEDVANEGANPFAKSGSGRSGSGKSGSGANPFAKKSNSGSGKMESQSAAEMMREYVEKISDGHGPEKASGPEGQEIGKAGKSFSVNKRSNVAGKNDMGGSAGNMLSGKGNDTSERDGQTSKAKAGGFMKSPVPIPGSDRNVNKVGGNKGAQNFYNTRAKAKSTEGSTTDGTVPVSKKSLGYPGR